MLLLNYLQVIEPFFLLNLKRIFKRIINKEKTTIGDLCGIKRQSYQFLQDSNQIKFQTKLFFFASVVFFQFFKIFEKVLQRWKTEKSNVLVRQASIIFISWINNFWESWPARTKMFKHITQ